MCRPAAGWLLALLLTAAPLGALAAQSSSATQQLEESRQRLEEIRRERAKLQADRERLQGQVHDLNQELDNLDRQRQTTNRIVNEIDTQIGGLNGQMDRVSVNLVLAQDNLAEKRAILLRRLVDIYKRGTLYPFEVLVAAESFGDLLNRYKYLYLTSQQDRTLVSEVEKLRDLVSRQRDQILGVRSELGRRREEREAELERYGTLAEERARRLREARRSARSTEQRLSELERTEARLNDVLASLERARREAVARASRTGAAPTTGSIGTGDIGKLDWPVDGTILYNFGRDTLPSGGVIRWNGIGIAAPVGTPVKAVEGGRIRLVQTLGTYGLSVLLDHGNGYYSFYAHLESAGVKPNTAVAKGQVIGSVGGANSDQGAHLYFEIRGESGLALDPADWLRKRRP
ncbi:MAG: murein hydrolase activator EnvC family protein [Gemmatimonadales bacterium]